ncbi:GIY-YIG nuclease family protein [Vacuolonema iberomarrocanum]|uniref:GIY-YIG nuclease family protein n=1 Tax=Vacuolonema iberomarrocanum TaxID=3454632 RepID=UPI0019E91071|nr:GIY-YIG nuclease family protein [filamentous cyanobacterium LEGE 07170]
MPRRGWGQIYVDRDPTDPYKGWGWVEVHRDDHIKFNVPGGYPKTYKEACEACRDNFWEKRKKYAGKLNLPARGRGGTNKFILNISGEQVTIRAQKSLTNRAVIAWVKTWAPPNAKLTTPGDRTISLNGEKLENRPYFVYFILNEDSNAIKIGQAKDVGKRLKSLQTSSPAQLKLMKCIQTDGVEAARQLEQSLHEKFSALRLAGEWFRAHEILLKYIEQN